MADTLLQSALEAEAQKKAAEAKQKLDQQLSNLQPNGPKMPGNQARVQERLDAARDQAKKNTGVNIPDYDPTA